MLVKCVFLRLAQVEIGEQPPHADRQVAHQRLLDLAEPAHESRQQAARNAVGEQEIDVLLLRVHSQNRDADRHGAVRPARITSRARWIRIARPSRSTRLGAAALAASLVKLQDAARAVAGQAPLARPAMRAWRAGSPRWCRSTNTTRRASSAPTMRRTTSPRAAAAGFDAAVARSIATRFAETIAAAPPRSRDGISDLQFTDAYRVPFQYSRYRARAPDGRRRSCSRPPA